MQTISLALKLSVTAALIAAVALVLFVIFPDNKAPVHPQLLWSIGSVLGIAAPVKAAMDHQPQQGPLYFGAIANVFFLAISDYFLHS